MRIDKAKARTILEEEARLAENGDIDSQWKERVEGLSRACEGASKTHVAFLGTAILAKAVDRKTNAFAVKARADIPGAYSARGLVTDVLAPLAPKLRINLGVTGREPLNNQPYFAIDRISTDVTIRDGSREAFNILCDILGDVQNIQSEAEARDALRAYIYVRRRYVPQYATTINVEDAIPAYDLILAIGEIIRTNSEGGKRAQAIAAGLMDLYAGPDRVVTSRINDPDRHLPGDVGIKSRNDEQRWEKIIEVRDKRVSVEDIYLFGQKAMESGVSEAAILAVADNQEQLAIDEVVGWALENGVAMTVFHGWAQFVEQVLFWSELPQTESTRLIAQLVHDRLVELEVSEAAVNSWTARMQRISDRR